MKGILIVADSARANPDGTFSLLRGGVDRAEIPPNAQTTVHRGSVLARIRGESEEEGNHPFTLVVQNDKGINLAPDVKGEIVIPKGGGSAVICLDFGFELSRAGSYSFALSVDGKPLDSWRVTILMSQAGMMLGEKK